MGKTFEVGIFQGSIVAFELFARLCHSQLSQPARLHHLQRCVSGPAVVDPLNHFADPGVAVTVHFHPEMAEGLEVALQLVNYWNAYAQVDHGIGVACQNVPQSLPDLRVPLRILDPCRFVYHPPGAGLENTRVQSLEKGDRGDGEMRGPVSEGLDERRVQLLDQLGEEAGLAGTRGTRHEDDNIRPLFVSAAYRPEKRMLLNRAVQQCFCGPETEPETCLSQSSCRPTCHSFPMSERG